MAFKDLFARKKDIRDAELETRMNSTSIGALMYGGSNYTQSKSLTLSAVYRCVDLISNSIAELPLYPYKVDREGFKTRDLNDPIYKVLNRPNTRMTKFTFFKTILASVLLQGNGYAYIERNARGIPVALHYIPNEWVVVVQPPYINMPLTYEVKGIKGPVPHTDMIHILNFTYDGVTGISTLAHAKNILELSYSADSHALGFYSSGCNVRGILQTGTRLTDESRDEIKGNWTRTFGSQGSPGGMVLLEGGMTYQPVTLDAQSSQLLETREFNVVEICRFFSVNPVKCYDLTKTSYASIEANELEFLTDTLTPYISKIEEELNYKLFNDLGKEVRFDTDVLLRNDKKSLSEYLSKMYQMGMTPNEIRRTVDLPPVDGGDTPFTQVNVMPLVNAINNGPTSNGIENLESEPKEDESEKEKEDIN